MKNPKVWLEIKMSLDKLSKLIVRHRAEEICDGGIRALAVSNLIPGLSKRHNEGSINVVLDFGIDFS